MEETKDSLMSVDDRYESKVIILGHQGVGKTSILDCFSRGYAPRHVMQTVGEK